MGNVESNTTATHRQTHYHHHHPYYPPPPPPTDGRNAIPSVVPYPSQYPNPNTTSSSPQRAVTIRNSVNVNKHTLKVVEDADNPGKHLVCFNFDATVAASITIYYFAKEDEDFKLTPTKESLLPLVTLKFEKGSGQKYKQPSGSGIDFSTFKEEKLLGVGDMEVYPLAVKAEAEANELMDGNPEPGATNSQITLAVFEKDKGEYHVRVAKQILWVNGVRYELQEIYGIGNSVDSDNDENDSGKECIICLSQPRDTAVLPCRHMCMCNECAKLLRFQTNKCPICRQPVQRLLEIKVSNGAEA